MFIHQVLEKLCGTSTLRKFLHKYIRIWTSDHKVLPHCSQSNYTGCKVLGYSVTFKLDRNNIEEEFLDQANLIEYSLLSIIVYSEIVKYLRITPNILKNWKKISIVINFFWRWKKKLNRVI